MAELAGPDSSRQQSARLLSECRCQSQRRAAVHDPGLNETLRINGTAELLTDPDLCEQFSLGGKPAKVVVVVAPHEAYLHCAKAFRRASLWEPDTWVASDDLPSGAEILRDHAAFDMPVDTLDEAYQADIEATLWNPGGDASLR